MVILFFLGDGKFLSSYIAFFGVFGIYNRTVFAGFDLVLTSFGNFIFSFSCFVVFGVAVTNNAYFSSSFYDYANKLMGWREVIIRFTLRLLFLNSKTRLWTSLMPILPLIFSIYFFLFSFLVLIFSYCASFLFLIVLKNVA